MTVQEAAPAPELYKIPEPSRKSRLEGYLWEYADETSLGVAEDFYDPNRPMADTAILIPVAAHQDAARIVPAMSEYALQDDAEPFTIFILLNSPTGTSMDDKYEAIIQVEEARRKFPNLDIRYSVLEYEKPIIGRIRKDLWDGAMRVALTDGLFDQRGSEVLGFNHDIDTERISRHYVRNVQAFYRKRQEYLNTAGMSEMPLSSQFTQVKHAYPFDTHPNIARAIFWSDLASRQVYKGGMFTEGLVVPFSYYAHKRGFDKNAVIQECRPIEPINADGILHTGMETSPRRYIERIGHDHSAEIWTDDSFSGNDTCRNPLALPGDISHEALEERIFGTLENDIRLFCGGIPKVWWQSKVRNLALATTVQFGIGDREGQTLYREVHDKMGTQLQFARHTLAGRIGSPLLASMIDYAPHDQYAREFTQDLLLAAA